MACLHEQINSAQLPKVISTEQCKDHYDSPAQTWVHAERDIR